MISKISLFIAISFTMVSISYGARAGMFHDLSLDRFIQSIKQRDYFRENARRKKQGTIISEPDAPPAEVSFDNRELVG